VIEQSVYQAFFANIAQIVGVVLAQAINKPNLYIPLNPHHFLSFYKYSMVFINYATQGYILFRELELKKV